MKAGLASFFDPDPRSEVRSTITLVDEAIRLIKRGWLQRQEIYDEKINAWRARVGAERIENSRQQWIALGDKLSLMAERLNRLEEFARQQAIKRPEGS